MYTTGIIRRIDDLGRIVIPKEIRKKLRIRDGDSLEILVHDNQIVLKKFSFLKSIEDYANKFTDAIYSYTKYNVLITNDTSIIACSGSMKKRLLNQNITEELITCIQRKEHICEKYKKDLHLTNDNIITCTYAISTITSYGNAVGLVVLFSEDKKITENEMNICEITAKILSKYLEE